MSNQIPLISSTTQNYNLVNQRNVEHSQMQAEEAALSQESVERVSQAVVPFLGDQTTMAVQEHFDSSTSRNYNPVNQRNARHSQMQDREAASLQENAEGENQTVLLIPKAFRSALSQFCPYIADLFNPSQKDPEQVEQDEGISSLQEGTERPSQAGVPVLGNQSEDSPTALASPERGEMQNQATELRAALRGIANFCTPPSNPLYTDDESGKVYYSPDQSHLISWGLDQFSVDEYRSYGVARNNLLTRPGEEKSFRYDLIYFAKHDDQVRFEHPSAFPTESSTFSITSLIGMLRGVNIEERMKERIEKQKKRYLEGCDAIKKKAKEWGYSKVYFLLRPKDLRDWGGFTEKEIIQLYAIAFFHKEVVSHPVRETEESVY